MILSGRPKVWSGQLDRDNLVGKAAYCDFVVEVVRRIAAEPGFKVLPRRWAKPARKPHPRSGMGWLAKVERTFDCMTRWRRLVRDDEARLDVSDTMVNVATDGVLLRRIAHP